MKIVYVILHYLSTQDTIECVESILNNIKSKVHESWIIVVDNGSPNNSYTDLEKVFQLYPTVKLIKSKENLGFAKGNNIGFKYAKYQLKANFIVLLNNDTIISQTNFTDVIVKKYEEKQYAVLGPDILTADGYHQNPGNKQNWNLNELRVYRLKKRIRLLLSYLHLDGIISKIIEQAKEVYQSDTLEGDIKNTILHGACLIFSPLYINCFEGLYDKTFLYMEEDILKLYADFYEFLMLYTSDLQIFHKEDVSTNMMRISNIERTRLKYKRLIKSSQIYSDLKKKMIKKKKIIKIVEKAGTKAKSYRGGGNTRLI